MTNQNRRLREERARSLCSARSTAGAISISRGSSHAQQKEYRDSITFPPIDARALYRAICVKKSAAQVVLTREQQAAAAEYEITVGAALSRSLKRRTRKEEINTRSARPAAIISRVSSLAAAQQRDIIRSKSISSRNARRWFIMFLPIEALRPARHISSSSS